MTLTARDLVNETLELASLPSVVMQAMEMINRPETSASDIGAIIAEDPALTARLLRIVNSAFYGFPSRIDTVSRAITIIGTLELTDLIVGSSAIDAFDGLPNSLVDMQQFWEHSMYTGIVARLLCRQLRAPNTERCFIIGLLHDLGSLVLYHQQPELSRQALEEAAAGKRPLHLAERALFGFDHGEVGAELMRSWNLPDGFIETALHHHAPSAAGRYRLETAVVHLADVISGMARNADNGSGPVPPLEPGAWELTGLTVDVMEQVVAEADAQLHEACVALLPNLRAA